MSLANATFQLRRPINDAAGARSAPAASDRMRRQLQTMLGGGAQNRFASAPILALIIHNDTVQDCPSRGVHGDDRERTAIRGSHSAIREHGRPPRRERRIGDGWADSEEPDMVHVRDSPRRTRRAVVRCGEAADDPFAVRAYAFNAAINAVPATRTDKGFSLPRFRAAAVVRPRNIEFPLPRQRVSRRLPCRSARHQTGAGGC